MEVCIDLAGLSHQLHGFMAQVSPKRSDDELRHLSEELSQVQWREVMVDSEVKKHYVWCMRV